MAFVLGLTDNTESVDFVSSTYKVADGGFDIGMPRKTRELTEIRPGFFRLIRNQVEYREATITFAVHGATRTAVIASVNKIERILSSIQSDELITDTTRGQLSYAWDGATYTTYFEVYAGDVVLPGDVLSVQRVHAQDENGYYVSEIQLKLFLSPLGYRMSIYASPHNGTGRVDVPLENPTVGSPTTAGIVIDNPVDASGNYNYVDISGSDIPGATPYITMLHFANNSGSFWTSDDLSRIYIGQTLSPFPTTLKFENTDIDTYNNGAPPSSTSQSGASGGSYTAFPFLDIVGFHPKAGADTDEYGEISWEVPDDVVGTYFAIAEMYNSITVPASRYLGIGYYRGFDNSGVAYSTPRGTNTNAFPLGAIQVPVSGKTVPVSPTSTETELAIYQGRDDVLVSQSIDLDYISLLPINQGFRVLDASLSGATGYSYYDDAWSGQQWAYQTDWGNRVDRLAGLLTPITLFAGRDQRLYFHIEDDGGTSSYYKSRPMTLKVHAVPTFSTLAY